MQYPLGDATFGRQDREGDVLGVSHDGVLRKPPFRREKVATMTSKVCFGRTSTTPFVSLTLCRCWSDGFGSMKTRPLPMVITRTRACDLAGMVTQPAIRIACGVSSHASARRV